MLGESQSMQASQNVKTVVKYLSDVDCTKHYTAGVATLYWVNHNPSSQPLISG